MSSLNSRVENPPTALTLLRKPTTGLLLLITLSLSPFVSSPELMAQDAAATGSPTTTADGTSTTGNSATDIKKGARIGEGLIPLKSFLRFIRVYTGKVVNFPSGVSKPPEFDDNVSIEIIGDIENLNFELCQAILEMNGYDIWEVVLDDGTQAYNIRHHASRNPPPLDPVVPIKETGDALPRELDQQLATLVLQLKYTDSSTVITALRELLDVQGSKSSTGSLKVVNVNQNQTLIIKSKVRLLRHIKELVKYIDVEVKGLEQILEIRLLEYADALDIVDILQQALDGPGGTTSGRSVPGGAARRASGGRGNTARPSSSGSTSISEGTRLIPDVRTQKIIIQSTNPDEVALIHTLIDELDSKIRNIRSKTHVYKVKYLKAEDLRDVVEQLILGSSGTLRGGNTANNRNTRASGTAQRGNAGGNSRPSRIVAHPETNSLLIQAEPEEFLEIKNILEDIDRKRRQVFLEAALVQVAESSTLNYTIEYLAGNLDNSATKIAAMSALGLSNLDVTQLPSQFVRSFEGATAQSGLLAAVSSNGQLPLLLRAIKEDVDSQIVATPYILADDNQPNSISILTTVYFEQTSQGQVTSTTSQASEEAGITLTLTPTISGSVVLLELELEVSDFGRVSSGSGSLPDKSTNRITSRVTIPDRDLFIIGGLTRENKSTAVSKIPLLGDLPIIGRLFQSRGSNKSRDNLYVFLTAHIIDDANPGALEHFSEQAEAGMNSFDSSIEVTPFTSHKPRASKPAVKTPETTKDK